MIEFRDSSTGGGSEDIRSGKTRGGGMDEGWNRGRELF